MHFMNSRSSRETANSSEQFSIQTTVFVKGLKLACLNEDLKCYNKYHPLCFHKRTALSSEFDAYGKHNIDW